MISAGRFTINSKHFQTIQNDYFYFLVVFVWLRDQIVINANVSNIVCGGGGGAFQSLTTTACCRFQIGRFVYVFIHVWFVFMFVSALNCAI